ncbi:hypothetical protein EKO27_g4131 [Xylaria grammica]|uniref:F-box domain-containing protein n=1 Tax=Xylaria grammica TaxID=363999 RepID=A0A439D9A6_9PEZI|nr:hypothetical protein EKO27_g4131 [Xylaria grammica]
MLLTLPDEILLKILNCLFGFLSYIRGPDVFACRLVCRRLSRIGEDIIFKDIVLAADHCGLRSLLDLSSSSLRHRVKKLRFRFEVFDPQLATSLARFAAKVRQANGWEIGDDFEDLREYFEEYRECFHAQTLFEQGMMNTPVLALALNRLENLRSIRLSQRYGNALEKEPDLEEDESPDVIQSPVGHTIFKALVDALAQCQGYIEDLELGEDPYDNGLVGLIQRLDPVSDPRYQQVFGNLKRLTIALPWTMGPNKKLNYSGLSMLIGCPRALEVLCLTFPCRSRDPLPPYFLRSIHQPNLSTLVLRNVAFQEPTHLLVFLQAHATTLRKLEIRRLILEQGSWETAVRGMRSVLRLESCSVGSLYIKKDGIDSPLEGSSLFYPAVGAFIRREFDDDPFKLLAVPTQEHGSS